MSAPRYLLKWTEEDGSPLHGGSGAWPLPGPDGEPGAWREAAEAVPCVVGLHGVGLAGALSWAGPALWLMEVAGPVVWERGKAVTPRARLVRRLAWDERSARLFACDCAERTLPIFERRRPGDGRPRAAVETARRFAVGDATAAELAAARDAAWAAGDAAWDVAWAAARAAAWAAWDVAWDVARAAAWAAAWAAGDVAWAAARDAARAAGDAAWDVAGAAARAAGDAAWDVAGAAARDAERAWQADLLAAVVGLTTAERAGLLAGETGGDA